MDFGSVTEDVVIKIGGFELMAQPDFNNTNVYFADLTSDDIQLASPLSSLNGASATCEFSYSFVSLFMYLYLPNAVKWLCKGCVLKTLCLARPNFRNRCC